MLTGSIISGKQGDEEAGRLFEAALIERERENGVKKQALEHLTNEITFTKGLLEFIGKINDNHGQGISGELHSEIDRKRDGGFLHG